MRSTAILRRAQRVEQVRALINVTDMSGPFSGICALFLLVAELYMTFTAWNLQASWIPVALVSLILMLPCAALLIEPRRRVINRMAQEEQEGALSESLVQHIHDPILLTVLLTVAALLLGQVFLMTNKPGLVTSILVMVFALVLGLVSGALLFSQAYPRSASMPTSVLSSDASI